MPYSLLNVDPEVMRHFPSMLTQQQSDEMVDHLAKAWADRGRPVGGGTAGHARVHRLHRAVLAIVERAAVRGGGVAARSPALGPRVRPGRCPCPGLRVILEHVVLPDDEIVSFTTTLNCKVRTLPRRSSGMRHDGRDFDHPLLPTWDERAHVLYCIDRRTWQAGVAR